MKGTECRYKEKDRLLKQQFKNGINDDDMKTKIIRVLTAIKRINEVISKEVLALAIRVQAQRTQKINRSIKESKEFNAIIRFEKKHYALN